MQLTFFLFCVFLCVHCLCLYFLQYLCLLSICVCVWVCSSKPVLTIHSSISGVSGKNITCTMLCSSVFVVLVALVIHPVPGHTRALHTPDKAMQVSFLVLVHCRLLSVNTTFSDIRMLFQRSSISSLSTTMTL